MSSSEELAEKALSNGDFQEAVNLFKRALESGQTFQKWSGLAVAYENLQAWPEARWASHKALDLDTRDTRMPALQKRVDANEANEKKSRQQRGCFSGAW